MDVCSKQLNKTHYDGREEHFVSNELLDGE